MSSLQKQLATIAASGRNELDLKAQKSAHSQSIIFEPSVASGQSFDVLYQICVDGFDELCQLDQRFARFAQTLFSQQSRSEDRAQMTTKQNEDLDSVLENFLGLVGGRLLLRPAIKAVEWLIRRFRIHEYNTATTILTFLPYHSSSLFRALLSILPKQLPPSFRFLHTYMSSLSSPPLSAFVYAAVHNPGFFAALNHYVITISKARHQYSALISTWASIAAQTIDSKITSSQSGRQEVQLERQQDLFLQILPILNEALSLKKAPETTLAAYTLLVILIARIPLQDSTLDAIAEAVVVSWTTDTFDAGVSCLALVAERKEDVRLPKAVVKGALRYPSLPARLLELSTHQPVQRLTIGITQRLILHQDICQITDGLQFVRLFQDNGILDKQAISFTLHVVSHADRSSSSGVQKDILSLLSAAVPHSDDMNEPREKSKDGSTESFSSQEEDDDDMGPSHFSGRVEVELTSLPTNLDGASFLAADATNLFDQFLSAFHAVKQKSATPSVFLAQKFWQSREKNQAPLLTTFLSRAWCTKDAAKHKCEALTLMLSHFKEGRGIEEAKIMLPHILVALQDQSKPVRQRAVDLTLELEEWMRLPETKDMAKNADHTSLWTLYDAPMPSSIDPSPKTLSDFLTRSLKPELEECVIDPQRTSRLLSLESGESGQNTANSRESHKKLKAHQRLEIMSWLAWHVSKTPLPVVKLGLLTLCNSAEKLGGQSRSKILLPCLRDWVASGDSFLDGCKREEVDISRLDTCFFESATPGDQESVDYLLSAARGTPQNSVERTQKASFQRLNVIWPSLKQTVQTTCLNTLLDMATAREGPKVSSTVTGESARFLRTAKVAPNVLSSVLHHAVNRLDTKDHSTVKKRRMNDGSATEHQGSLDNISHDLAALNLGLEMIDLGETQGQVTLFHTLFIALKAIRDCQSQTSANVDFVQVSIITELSDMAKIFVDSPPKDQLDPSIIRIDVLIDCIRKTSNAQARNAGLNLLAKLARLMPEPVLQHVIPIFTLMGATTLRQGDESSIYIVDQTIKEVIPLLVDSLRAQNSDLVSATAEVVLSFAAAFDHVSPPRRLRLYGLLASSLGAEDSLCAIVSSLVDRYPQNDEVLRFTGRLVGQFSSIEALQTLRKYIGLITSCCHQSPSPYNSLIRKCDDEQEQNSQIATLFAAVPEMIRDGIKRSQVVAGMKKEETSSTLRSLYAALFEQIFEVNDKIQKRGITEKSTSSSVGILLNQLPFREFVQTISPLFDSGHIEVSRSILKSLETQLRDAKAFDTSSKVAALGLLPRLTSLLKGPGDSTLPGNAIVCIDHICEKFGKLDIAATFKTAEFVSNSVCASGEKPLLRALSLHSLSSTVEVLQTEFIPLLPKTLQLACEGLEQSMDDRDVRLHNAAYSVPSCVVEQLAYVMPTGIMERLLELSHASGTAKLGQDADDSRRQLLEVAASKLDVKTIFTIAVGTWPSAVQHGPNAVKEQLQLVQTAIERHGKSAIGKHARDLLEAFPSFFDLGRIVHERALTNLYPADQLKALESDVADALISLVLKINDASFRPFFAQLVEWTTSLPTANAHGTALRQAAVFDFLTRLSDRLKSLVTTYFSFVLEPIQVILTQPTLDTTPPTKKAKATAPPDLTLALSAIAALASALRHDTDDFFAAPARFTPLSHALLAPLSSTSPVSLTGPNAPASALRTSLVPALVALAAAVASVPDHLTALNAGLLALMRPAAEDRRARLAAVVAMRAVTSALGEDWLALLPQMLPVISELLEDGDERVERETSEWVAEMEGVLGESLEGMLA